MNNVDAVSQFLHYVRFQNDTIFCCSHFSTCNVSEVNDSQLGSTNGSAALTGADRVDSS